jgi:hypothetical protein
VNNCEVGGAVDQKKLVIVYAVRTSGLDTDLLSGVGWGAVRDSAADPFPSDQTLQNVRKPTVLARPMSNLLRPFGVPYKAFGRSQDKPQHAPNAQYEPLPPWAGSWIQTTKGVRRLLADELARGIGIPKSWGDLEALPGGLISNVTSLHIWESIAPTVAALNLHLNDSPTLAPQQFVDPAPSDSVFESEAVEWTWEVPDISHGSEWHRARVMNLLHACKSLPGRERLFEEGLTALDVHRTNYGSEGAQHLQLLWWEFPPEHWHDLRNGCPMNFLVPPKSGIVLNSAMTDEQKTTAIEFVEELCQLGVLQLALPGEVVTNCPLFILAKAGQPGQ